MARRIFARTAASRKAGDPRGAGDPQPAIGKAAVSKAAKRKRGIVLLIVVSLLALFVLMGVAYAIVASHYLHTAESNQRDQEVGDPPEREMENVLGQLIFDTLGRSALRNHSLLYDLYGIDSIAGRIVGAPAVQVTPPAPATPTALETMPGGATQPQVWQFSATATSGALSTTPGFYSGRVLTFLSGQAAGQSTRIVECAFIPGNPMGMTVDTHVFAVETPEPTGANFPTLAVGDNFIINGAPFNGSGFGFSPSDLGGNNLLDALYGAPDPNNPGSQLLGNPIALLPHFSGYDPVGGVFNPVGATPQVGGPDESWDAVDFQNMLMAMVAPMTAELHADVDAYNDLPVIPSLHRPELINYWLNNMPSDIPRDMNNDIIWNHEITRNFLRTIILRPMPFDHPNFTGSNPAFDASHTDRFWHLIGRKRDPSDPQQAPQAATMNPIVANLWDIDNDNDGVPDSIWVDPGLPVITSPDGRRYKRLVAILVKDMDGRIDLNAHGNLHQTSNANHRPETATPGTVGGLAGSGIWLTRGIGFGPAEVQFLNIFSNGGTTSYTSILTGRYTSNLTGDTGLPGIPNLRDDMSFAKHHGVPNNYSTQYSWYASPPDVYGRAIYVLDHGGQPTTLFMGQNNEMLDTPYELSLSGQPNNADSPYTWYEFERMARFNDGDVTNFASRPLALASSDLASTPGVIDANHSKRELLRVSGSYVPTPMTTGLRERRNTLISSSAANSPMGTMTVIDLYRERLLTAGVNPADLDNALRRVVPWEFFHGQKFDINRWMGDGADSNGDETPDDPQEAPSESAFSLGPSGFTGITGQHTNSIDMTGDNVAGPADNAYARQLYARHLYCLAMLMLPPGFQPACPHDATITPAQYRRLINRRIAQWAINCADFRDPDSIMSSFEYDENPFNDDDGNTANGTWDVDGFIGNAPGSDGQLNTMDDVASADDANGYRGFVWGLEYPDLLINETIALHDRRVKDTEHDASGNDRDDTPMNDETLDQFRVPQGSLFVELYCPRNTYNRNPRLPRELYDYTINPLNPRLALGKLAPDGRPVWRMAISPIVYDDDPYDDRHPNALAGTNVESASFEPLEVNRVPGASPNGPAGLPDDFRFAYFGDASALPSPGERDYAFYNTYNTAMNPLLVEPGQYVVVGPRTNTYLGSIRPADPATNLWDANSPQYIQLNGTGITIVDADGTTQTRTPNTDIRPAVHVICDMPGVVPQYVDSATGMRTNWDPAPPWNIGLNISEPLPRVDNYYPEPNLGVTPAGAAYPDFYDDPDTAMTMGGFPGIPVESPGVAANADRPIAERDMNRTGAYTNASSVYLQRLANPNLAWNANNNPYITIDWATIDLNVFSGEEDSGRTVGAGPDMGDAIDPDDDPDNWDANNNDGDTIGSRQRGYSATPPTPDANFWNPLVAATPPNLPGAGAPEPYFRRNLAGHTTGTQRHSLGYVNPIVGQPQSGTYLGETSLTGGGQTSPNLAWHNRPFTSPMELLMVPTSAPSRLGWEITPGTMAGIGAVTGNLHYDSNDPIAFRSPFGTLFNFFHTSDAGSNANAAAHLYRILDFVEVPSPYAGAERWYNPGHFSTVAASLRPPFAKVSRFRDPGRININTIFDERIWNAAIAQIPLRDREPGGNYWNQFSFFEKVMQSRQGYGGALLAFNNDYPTYFANPFRTADSSDLMPDVGTPSMRKDRPVDATLLRPDPNTGVPEVPLFSNRSTLAYDNTERNPYFRYQGLQKIGNIFSTQSNVYAVWMTMGYFEVAPAEMDFNGDGDTTDAGEHWDTMTGAFAGRRAAWPDRYMLGPEIGSETGEVKRHRAFFIIDRSIPVGFAPGQKLNTDKCILLRRFIE